VPVHGPVAAVRSRLRLATAAAAREGDRATVTALLTHAQALGLPTGELAAVAERHWPRPALPRRLGRAGRRWTAAQLRRAMRHLRHTPQSALGSRPEREPQP
jgi:hypothetical protein